MLNRFTQRMLYFSDAFAFGYVCNVARISGARTQLPMANSKTALCEQFATAGT
jgi:hypothetical protein